MIIILFLLFLGAIISIISYSLLSPVKYESSRYMGICTYSKYMTPNWSRGSHYVLTVGGEDYIYSEPFPNGEKLYQVRIRGLMSPVIYNWDPMKGKS